MPSGFLCNLNTAFSFGLRRAFGLPGSINSVSSYANRPAVDLLVGPGRVFISSSESQFSNRRNNLFAVGAVRQAHSRAFVSWSHSEYTRNLCWNKRMAASSSIAASGDLIVDNLIACCGNVSRFAKPTGAYFGDRTRQSCRKARLVMRSREIHCSPMAHGYFIFDISQRSCNSNLLIGEQSKDYYTSSSLCCSDGAVPDLSVHGLSLDEQLVTSTISAEQKILGERTLKLLSGSCYLPHPDKEETGGEDAHFCVDDQAIGVADGVGGWADVGINAGYFARELMSNSVSAILNEPKGCIVPARVLDKAHSKTKAKGSSTACIIAITDQGIHAINLGDSGFIVLRDGCTIFKSPVQQHGFNFTYQLESGNTGDLPSSGQVFTIPVSPGDVVVAGTDGLFDNLYNNELTAVVVHGVRAGLSPEATAQKIAALARQRALDRNRKTPFSTAAQEAGFRYSGGKLDDITVVVSYICGSMDT